MECPIMAELGSTEDKSDSNTNVERIHGGEEEVGCCRRSLSPAHPNPSRVGRVPQSCSNSSSVEGFRIIAVGKEDKCDSSTSVERNRGGAEELGGCGRNSLSPTHETPNRHGGVGLSCGSSSSDLEVRSIPVETEEKSNSTTNDERNPGGAEEVGGCVRNTISPAHDSLSGSDSELGGRWPEGHQIIEPCNEPPIKMQSTGVAVRSAGEVLKVRAKKTRRRPNMNCKVDLFGRVVSSFDSRRIEWVEQMGFGGLLNLVDMQLPRMLCYWLMTRIDYVRRVLVAPDGHQYTLHPNQVNWVLGIPCGGIPLPKKMTNEESLKAVSSLEKKYCIGREKVARSSGKLTRRHGIKITEQMLDRIEGQWDEADEGEFKFLFLILALEMVLCPTQSERLSKDLIPTLQCSSNARNYDWGSLVLHNLMNSVERFNKRFDADGYAGGGGGCSIFIAVFYLDRLARSPVWWGRYPRIAVWSADEIRNASNADRFDVERDFGQLGMLDVAYGEVHPLDPRDSKAPPVEEGLNKLKDIDVLIRKRRCKRSKNLNEEISVELKLNNEAITGGCSSAYNLFV